jgi:hypothetical protein
MKPVKKIKVLVIGSIFVIWALFPAFGQDAPQLPPPDKTRPTGDPWKPPRPPKPPAKIYWHREGITPTGAIDCQLMRPLFPNQWLYPLPEE